MRQYFLYIIVSLLCSIQVIAQGPIIDVWYGDEQYFGQTGNNQNWVNVLGNVSDPDTVVSIGYTLNGSSINFISLGPDSRRLENNNDFNIDIEKSDLVVGSNAVTIIARDKLNNETSKPININYTPNVVWPDNYEIKWDTVTNIQNVAQVIDGKWEITPNGLRVLEPGYDRLVGIGDVSWDDYEASFPVTIHKLDSPGRYSGNTLNVGALIRWTGHTDVPVSGWQPKSGFEPLGEIAWFKWNDDDRSNPLINFWYGADESFATQLNKEYMFKVRVASLPDLGHYYSLKVWDSGLPEPDLWNLHNYRNLSELSNGSILLLAHHVDATFGDISIRSVNPQNFPVANYTFNIDPDNSLKVLLDASTSTDPNDDIVKYVWELGDGNIKSGITVNHTYNDVGIYTVQLTVIDSEGYSLTKVEDISINRFNESTIVSDDFSKPDLNQSVWKFVNPKNDGTFEIEGYNSNNVTLNLSVPSGTAHDIWSNGNEAVRIMQGCNDSDFQIETKFLSKVTKEFQLQGLVLQQDDNNFIRYDYYSDGSRTHYFVAKFTNGTPQLIIDEFVEYENYDSLYLKVSRIGDQWNMQLALDDNEWSQATTFTHALQVDSVGITAGNAGNPVPSHVVKVDYFFNSVLPIDPEDAPSGFPFAGFTLSKDAEDPFRINLDASDSYDPNGEITNYDWDFGDGESGSGQTISYRYKSGGSFTISLTVKDNDGNETSVTKTVEIVAIIISDDFNSETLNTDIWTFIDPVGDGLYIMEGFDTDNATISLGVPAGTSHNIWDNGNEAVRIMQPASNSNFEVEIKFETAVEEQFQAQGFVVEQDSENLLRFDFYSDGSSVHNFASKIANNKPTAIVDSLISTEVVKPLFLRVKRNNLTWSMSYSLDGFNWRNTVSFDYFINVSNVGIYSLNAGSNPPAFISRVDYFFNTENPIDPEDGVELVTNLSPSSINKMTKIKLYPNPSSEFLNIKLINESGKYVCIRILNNQGRIIETISIQDTYTNELQINTSDLPDGLYIMETVIDGLKEPGYTQYNKFLIQH